MKDEVIVITGGTSGYGKETARLFAQGGYKVIITGHNAERLQAAAEELGTDSFLADATSPADWEKLYNYVVEKYGKIDFLLNNAGGGVSIKETAQQSVEDIDRIMMINLNSTIYGCRQFAPLFMKQKFGTIMNVSSVCAKLAWPGWTVYAASKWGVLGFTKGLTTELGPYGIRVSCILPGAGDTNFDKNANFTERGMIPCMKGEDIAKAIYDAYNLPKHIWVEEFTVWGIDQISVPL